MTTKMTGNGLKVFARELSTFAKSDQNRVVRRALSRTKPTLRREINNAVKKELKLPTRTINKELIRRKQSFGGGHWSLYFIQVIVLGRSLPLIHFVPRASRKVKNWRGVPNSRRKQISAEIVPGKRFKLKGGFVQLNRKGKPAGVSMHVFRRGKGGKSRMTPQRSSTFSYLKKQEDQIRQNSRGKIDARFGKELREARRAVVQGFLKRVNGGSSRSAR